MSDLPDNGDWVFGDSPEHFFVERYASRAAAITEARDTTDPDGVFWVGRVYIPDPAEFVCDVGEVIEACAQEACDSDHGGEWAEGYLYDVGKEAKQELADALIAWLRKHGRPYWFVVTDVERVCVSDE